jgi:hypothetical protein
MGLHDILSPLRTVNVCTTVTSKDLAIFFDPAMNTQSKELHRVTALELMRRVPLIGMKIEPLRYSPGDSIIITLIV